MALIQLRRGTTEEWAELNPILIDGEPGVDTTLGLIKIGNGIDAWDELPIIEGPQGEQGIAGVAGVDGPPGADGAAGFSGVELVNHGSVGSTARPAGAPLIYWIGTATPANATAWDWWLPENVVVV